MMGLFEQIAFLNPWALAALASLPVIWWLLRFTPPVPQSVKFPPLRILLGLENKEQESDKTPWWLLLLRLAIAALLILGVSYPDYAPGRTAAVGSSPLLLVVDDSWPASRQWNERREVMKELLQAAQRQGAPVTLAVTAPEANAPELAPKAAADALTRAAALEPRALPPARLALLDKLNETFSSSQALRVIWISDGIDNGDASAFAEGLAKLGGGRAEVETIVPDSASLPLAIGKPAIDSGAIAASVHRAAPAPATPISFEALAANGRRLASAPVEFTGQANEAKVKLELPLELRNEVSRLEVAGQDAAGSVFLMDDRWRRKTVALLSGSAIEDAQPLLSPLYYVSRAMEPYAEVSTPADAQALKETLDAGVSMVVLADIGVLPADSREAVKAWVEKGGLLVRFAGPKLASATDDMVPVTLRQGGRSMGSALSWESPQALQDFGERSPFSGLTLDNEVRVTRQVLAEPDADLQERIWASLADGTPLVTARQESKGNIVLFHVTANADWSNLPVSGLFVSMLNRLLDLAPSAGSATAAAASAVAGEEQAYTPRRALAGDGRLADPPADARPIQANAIDAAIPSPQNPAGIYIRGASERAVNLQTAPENYKPISALPSGVAMRDLKPLPAIPLAPYLFTAAFILLLLDCLAALVLGGGWQRLRGANATASMLLLGLFMLQSPPASAQAVDDFALQSTLQTHLAYVRTGDATIDDTSALGLKGLGLILSERTSVVPGEPMGIDIEKDEIVFFPLLYWPVTPTSPVPSDAALARIDAFMKNGGTIFFDLREDGAEALSGGASSTSEALQRMLAKLDIPAIEPVPPDHVLTKSFYLMQGFPGRYAQGRLWVERADERGALAGNADGVSSIMIGSNDYAAAWALDDNGQPLNAVIPGSDDQREMSFRAGVNIVMYALTGNYKADQVHVPALLERLGQ